MFKSPLVLPLALIFGGVLAFMATTGLLPADVLSFWPIIFVVLGLVALVSLSTEELMGQEKSKTVKKASDESAKPKSAAKKASSSKATSPKKSVSKKTAKKTTRK